MSIVLEPIGVIRSPFKDVEGMPIQPSGAADVRGSVILDEAFAEGLADLDGFSHIILLYQFHAASGFALRVKPFLDHSLRGVFATRAPRRPNAIGLSVVRLLGVSDTVLHIRGVDVLDRTPLIDIKPYVPRFDAPENVRTGWLETTARRSATISSDSRFKS